MILKAFQGQGLDWKSYIGVGGKSFRQHEESTSLGYNILPSFITDKIVTKRSIKGQLKDTSIYDNFDASGLLSKIRQVDQAVQAGQMHWSDYYSELKDQPELSWVKDFIQSNDIAEIGLDDVIAAQETARLGAVNFNNALKSTLTTTKLMGATMKVVSFAGNMLIGAGISLAVEAAIKGIDNLIHHSEKLIEAGKQADENISNAISNYQEKVSSIQDLGKQVADNPSSINTTAKAIDSLAEKYTKLHLGVKADGSNSTLSTDEYSEFLNISNQLADLFPSLKVGTDEQGNALLNLGTNASATARQLQDLVDVQKTLTHSEIVDNANDSYAGMMEQIKDYNNQISDLENKQEDYANYNPTTSLSSVSKSIENGYLTLRGLSNEEVDKVKKAIADNFKEFDDENDVNATSTWEDGDYIVTINLADQVSKTERKSKSSQVSDAISAYLKDNTANVKIESNEVNAQKKALEAQKQQLISEFASNTVTPYLQTTSVLSNFDSELMAALTNNAKNFDYSSIESEYGGDVDEMLRQKIVVPLQQLKPDAQDALRDALNLNPDDLSTNDYTKQIDKYLSKVSSDKDVQDSWKKTFGLDKIIEEATSKSDSLVEAFGDSYKNQINKLSGEDRNLLYSITIEDSAFDGTWQDAMNKLDELKNKSEETSESFDLSSFATNATKHINAISNITSALSESKSGTGLSLAAEVDDETGAVSLSGSLKNLQDIYMDLKDETGEPLFKNSAELSEALLERTATTAQPSQASTVPTKNESKYVTTKNQNGTWLNQDGRWWYQHNDGGWTNDGWESINGQWYKFDREGWMQTGWQPWGTDSTGNAAWYYLTDSGAMARSTWVAGANGAQYYVDSTGVMARNGYVRSADGSKYYWVNADGVWNPSWTTTAPNLSKYKLYYSTGTPKAKNELAFMDDMDGKLNLGSEAMITEKGILGNWCCML